jgi:hypothetical protein
MANGITDFSVVALGLISDYDDFMLKKSRRSDAGDTIQGP